MISKTFNKGDVIFRQGDYPKEIFCILSGSVGVYIDYEKETEMQIAVLNANEFLGEMGLIEVYPRSATAVAMEDGTELRVISDKEFSDYFEENPLQLLLMMRQMSQRLRERTEDYRVACQVLDELDATSGKPEQRSSTLKDKIDKILESYNGLLAEYPYSLSDSDVALMQTNCYYTPYTPLNRPWY